MKENRNDKGILKEKCNFWMSVSNNRYVLRSFCVDYVTLPHLKHCFWHCSVFAVVVVYLLCDQQVRDSDPKDPKRERIVELIDDFRIPGANGERIL